jgi:SEL1 protein
VLLQAAAVLCADTQKVVDPQNYEAADPNTDVLPDQLAQQWRHPGAELVDAALAELRKIPYYSHHRSRRPSGVIGAAFRYALKALPSIQTSAPPQQTRHTPISGPLLEAVHLLEEAAQEHNPDALYLLAEMNTFGNYSHPRDLKSAFDYYKKLALVHGNSTAQYMLGVFYATGIGNVVPTDQGKALLYFTFAAIRGDTRGEMAVAYRHHAGVATPKNCDTAVKYYKRVADKAIAWYRSGPPGGMAWVQEAYRIADDFGGAYGEGASVASAGINAIKASVNSDARAAIDDVIEYLDLMSQKGDSKSSFNLGRIYYDGQRGLERDLDLAKKYFFMVAKRYWKKDGRILENYKPGIEKVAAKAAGYIGKMYLRGDGVDQNFERAKMWFERGISHGDAQSQHGMGLMMLNGYGKASSEQDYAPAQIELGVLFLDQGGQEDVRVANNYFELAARFGSIEAHYYLAEMIFHGVGRDKACGMALGYYKNVAEKAEPLVSSWAEANYAYEAGDHESALLEYIMAAEQGYERAQNNVAHMLDPVQSRLPVPALLSRHKSKPTLLENPTLALMYWTRSSKQSNVDSMVKMGDYYFYGIGTEPDIHKAVQCYTGASEYSQSAQALYNLGWMHENGVGLTQDFHLAKRYYDQALEINEEAYLPVTLSLLKLRVRSAWNTFTHGRVNSIQDDPSQYYANFPEDIVSNPRAEPKKDWSLSEWVANFLQDDRPYYDDILYDDIFDDTIPAAGDGADLDDGALVETLIILSLVAALALLVYYRQQRQQQAQRREEEARRRQGAPLPQQQPVQQDRGLFPQPGDPDFANWMAGGIGH